LTNQERIYNEIKTVSSIKGAGKIGHPHAEEGNCPLSHTPR